MNNHTNQYYKDKKLNVAFGLPCDGLGDTICATPTIRKVAEAYRTKIDVYSKHPEVFKNLPYVSRSLPFQDITDNIKRSYDSYYQTEIALTHFNDQDVKFKHSHMDIRQIHANFIGFTLLKEDSHCDFVADKYEPIDGLPEKYIVIHATESWASKDWGFEKWNSFCNQLDYPIVMVGKESSEVGSFMVKKPTYNLQPKQGFDLRNKTNVHQLWHVLDKAQLVVTNDSSVMHLSGTTDTEILVLGSSQRPEIRFPYRNGSQDYKIRMVLGSCDLFCASDLRYNVIEHGTLNEVGPVVYCLEDKDSFECHPSVDSVINEVKNIVNIENKFQWGGTPEWLKERIIQEFFVPKYDKYTLYEEKYKINKDDVVLDIGGSCGPFVYKIQDRAKHIYSIEPNSLMTGALKENSNSNVTIIEKAFGKDGSIILQENNNDTLDGLGDPYEIESISLRSIIKNNNIDYIDFLKIDCESAEYYVFAESVDYIKEKVGHIAGEMHLHNEELKEKFKDFYFNFLPHMKNYTFTDINNTDVTKNFEVNFDKELNFYNQILVFIDVPKKKEVAVPIFSPSGGKLLAVGQHLSTGGSCEYMLKFLETFKDDYDEIKVIEYSNFGENLRIHKDKIRDLVGEENVICLGKLHVPMDQWIEEKRELKNIINDYKPDVVWFNELPSGFEYKQPEKELMDWIYRKDRPYELICTTHNNKAFVRDERQSMNTLPFYEPDKFVFCTKLHFEFSKNVDIPKELWEYPIENRVRPNRKETLSKLELEEYEDYYHILQVGIVNGNKNQKFSVDLSKKLIHKKVMFHFIGNDTMIEHSGVSYEDFELPNIRYWGERYDVDNFMSCMDLFLFPSYRELNPLAVKQALSWGMEVFALPKNHKHEELNYTLDYLDIKNFHLLKDEDIYEYILKQNIQQSEAKLMKIYLNDDIRSTYSILGKAKKESNVVLILDENQNVITDKIYSGTKYWKDYEKVDLYTL